MSVFHFRSTLLLDSTLFKLRGSTTPYAIASASVLHNPLHPLHARTVERYQQHLQQLNEYYVVPLSIHKSSCVRSRIRRRLNEASRLALSEYGYKLDGSPVNKMSGLPKILGSLAYFPEYEVVSAPWEKLMGEVKEGITRFMEMREKEQGQGQGHKSREDKRWPGKGSKHKHGSEKYGGEQKRKKYPNPRRQQHVESTGHEEKTSGAQRRKYPIIRSTGGTGGMGRQQHAESAGHVEKPDEYRLKLTKNDR